MLNKNSRLLLHNRCEELGLWHHSKNRKGERLLIVEKPSAWRWNYSQTPTPYKKPKPKTKRPPKIPKKIFCDECGANSHEKDILVNWTGEGPYCEECIEADDELNGHKWELPFY